MEDLGLWVALSIAVITAAIFAVMWYVKPQEIILEDPDLEGLGVIQYFENVGTNPDGTDKYEKGAAPVYHVAVLLDEEGEMEVWAATKNDRERFAKRYQDNKTEFIAEGIIG